jgi:putative membrane protein
MHFLLLILSLLFSFSALGHSTGDEIIIWSSWNYSWHILLTLFLMMLFYFRGWKKTIRKPSSKNITFFILSILSLIIALISPVDPLSDKLGFVHMIQHTLLMMVAAPLLVMSSPDFFIMRSIPSGLWKLKGIRNVYPKMIKIYRYNKPMTIWALYAVTLWLWHLPIFYEAALTNSIVHDVQHLAFFLTSYLFWRVVLDRSEKRRLNSNLGVLYLFVASLHAMILGVLMAFSPVAWYDQYVVTAPVYGFTGLEDQQIAGYIMWMPAGISYFVVAVVLMKRVLQDSSHPLSDQ